MIESNFFDSNYGVGNFVSGLVDNSIGSLANFVDSLVAFDFGASWTIADHTNELKINNKINKSDMIKPILIL